MGFFDWLEPKRKKSGGKLTLHENLLLLYIDRGYGAPSSTVQHDRGLSLGRRGYIDTSGTWKLTSKGKQALARAIKSDPTVRDLSKATKR